ncbi:MAG: hypothetical protein EAX89_00040 [Candidatus Lokiarchaeota archaeon]|nr:hypothetical protein [Candidatus Lokiarchaeota archaeon]
MSNNIELKVLEKKAWRTTFDDGIFDIYMGILIISIGFGISFYDYLPFPINILIGPIIIGLGLAFFILSKKYLIQPRIGIVKFGRKRKVRKLKTMIIISINVVFLFTIFLLNLSGIFQYLMIPPFLYTLFTELLVLTLPLCLVAYFLQYNRLYFIAILMGISFSLADASSIFIPIPFNFLITYLLIGGLIIGMGLFYFIRFLHRYPLTKREVI